MKITTLEYIHKLLKHDFEIHEKALKIARDSLYKAEEDKDKDLKTFEELYEKARKSLEEARDALFDFEDHEW